MIKLKTILVGVQISLFLLIFLGLTDKVFAEDKRIYLSTPQYARKIPAGGKTRNFRIKGIPLKTPGQIRLRIKWHSDTSIPKFAKLHIKLRHGESKTLRTKNCYSYHSSGKSPKCVINFTVSQAEANRYSSSSGDFWDLNVTNYSAFGAKDFNIEKGNDMFVTSFSSVYRTTGNTCMTVRKNLYLSAGSINIPTGSSRTREIKNIDKFTGYISLTGKWHTNNPLKPFVKLRIQLIKPDGKYTKSSDYYSIHSTNTQKPKLLNKEFSITPALAQASGKWKIKVTNNSGTNVFGFDLKKGSDINPLIYNFNSFYQVTCSNN